MVYYFLFFICSTCLKLCLGFPHTSEEICEFKWTKLGDSIEHGGTLCMRYYSTPKSWSEANKVCLEQSSNLLILDESYYHAAQIKNASAIFQKVFDTVLENRRVALFWTSLAVIQSKLWWHQTVPKAVLNARNSTAWTWAPSQPRIESGKCACALNTPLSNNQMRTFKLKLHPCDNRLPYICVKPRYVLQTSQASFCPSEWYGASHINKCWKYFHSDPVNYNSAKDNCAKVGARVASPSTEVDYRFMVEAVERNSEDILTCVQCNNASSEEECLNLKRLQICSSNEICSVTVNLTPGRMKFSKGCESEQTCLRNRDRTMQNCHSGDLVFQAGFTKLDCFSCCNTTNCNSHIMNGTLPLSSTLRNFFDRMPKDQTSLLNTSSQVGQQWPTILSSHWIGLKKDADNYTWDNGAEYDVVQSSNHFVPTYEGSLEKGCVKTYAESRDWEVVNCTESHPYVCEFAVQYEPPRIISNPSDIAIVRKSLGWRRTQVQHPNMTFSIDNYQAFYPVIWVKDGIYINNGLAPSGLVLNITKDLLYVVNGQQQSNLVSLQGYYHCELLTQNKTKKIISKPALLRYKDVLTYRGILQLPNLALNSSMQKVMLEWGSSLLEKEINEVLNTLMRVKVSPHVFNPDVEINGFRILLDRTVIDFSLYYTLSNVASQSWNDILEILNITVTKHHRDKYSQFITEFDEKFFKNLEKSIDMENIKRKSFQWEVLKPENISINDITIRSTISCVKDDVQSRDETIHFMTTAIGEEAKSDEVCLSNGIPFATRMCSGNFTTGANWEKPEFYSHCIQPIYSKVTSFLKELSETEINKDNIKQISQDLVAFTEDDEVLNVADIVYASKVVRNLANTRKPDIQVGDKIVEAVDNVLSTSKDTLKKAQLIDHASTRILEGIDVFCQNVEINPADGYSRIVESKLALEIHESHDMNKVAVGFGTTVNSSEEINDFFVNFYRQRHNIGVINVTDYDFRDIDSAVLFSDDVFGVARDFFFAKDEMHDIFGMGMMSPDTIRITFKIHYNTHLFLSPSQLEDAPIQNVLNSHIISGEINGANIFNLNQPVRAIFKPLKNISLSKQQCVYWDFNSANGLGNWSTHGCWMEGTIDDRIVCYCNHLTNFAVLTQAEYTSMVSSAHTLALSIITVIGIILSIVGLTLTIFTYVLFRSLRKGMSQKVLVNLAVALLCVNVIFLAGIDRTENYYGCLVVAVLLHYFLLVAFGWMLVEGVIQYLKFVKVLNTYIENFMVKTSIPVWGCPALISIVVASIDWRLFRGQDDFCWLDVNAFYYAFLIPVGCVIIVNTVLFTLVVKGITCDRPKGLTSTQSKRELEWLQIQATVSCFVVLGLSWIFGFLAVKHTTLAFQYLFCIFNAFQGFWIFICYCIREPAARTHWLNLLRCKQHLGRKKKFSTATTTSSSLFSTSSQPNVSAAARDESNSSNSCSSSPTVDQNLIANDVGNKEKRNRKFSLVFSPVIQKLITTFSSNGDDTDNNMISSKIRVSTCPSSGSSTVSSVGENTSVNNMLILNKKCETDIQIDTICSDNQDIGETDTKNDHRLTFDNSECQVEEIKPENIYSNSEMIASFDQNGSVRQSEDPVYVNFPIRQVTGDNESIYINADVAIKSDLNNDVINADTIYVNVAYNTSTT